jgi:hypothetical protein
MSLVRVPLLHPTSGGELNATPTRMANMYPTTGGNAKSNTYWRNTPGWSQLLHGGNVAFRGAIEFKGTLYVVRGGELVKYINSSLATATSVGTLSSKSGRVHIAEDGISLLISDGEAIYRWDDTTFSTVAIPTDLTAPTNVIFHDGHFICYQADSGSFYISNKFDGSTWDTLDYAVAEDKPDNIVGLASDRVLWVYGEYTTQAYYNNGAAFPFQPNPQGLLRYGMVGDTSSQLDNTTYWLARSKTGVIKAVKANGYVPIAVSTLELEETWAEYGRTEDAFSNTIMWQGHEWWVVTFPSANKTFVYDTQGAWFEWGNVSSKDGTIVRHPLESTIYFRNQNLFFDVKSNIQKFSSEIYKHGDDVMNSTFTSTVQHVDGQRLYLNNLIMDMRTGVGTPEADAMMELRISYDSGHTFSSWDSRSLGMVGDYDYRVEWHGLGSGFDIVVEGRITDEVPRFIMGALMGIDVYTSYLENRNQRSGIAQ